jgi:hypothetical protein
MVVIIWKRLLVVNWPLSELSNWGVLQNEAVQWLSLAQARIESGGTGWIGGLRIAVRMLGCAMTGLRH